MDVLIIGLDGGTWRVLEPLVVEGKLPFLRSLIEQGASGELISTIPPVTAPAWATFQTGVLPGKHGIYDFVRLDFARKKVGLVNARALKQKTLWKLASEAGKRVVTINVPLTYPPQPINGAVVGGMLSPGVSPDFVYPREIFSEVIQKVRGYRILVPRWSVRSLKLEDFIAEQIEVEAKRFEVAHLLWERVEPDLMMVHIQSSDVIQHAFWHYLDPSWPEYAEEAHAVVARFYQAMDRQMEQLYERTRPRYLLLLSDHGFGPIFREVKFNLVLRQAGLLKLAKPVLSGYVEEILRTLDRTNLLKRAAVRLLGHNAARKWRSKKSSIFDLVDWERTRCLVTASIGYGTVFFNRAFDQEETREKLREVAEALTDPRTGERVYRKVYFKEELYGDTPLGPAPDAVLEPSEGFSTAQDLSGIRVFRNYRPGVEDTGSHAMEGIWVAVGPGLPPGARMQARLVDMTPTLLSWMGLPIPGYMDGVPVHVEEPQPF